MSIIPHTAEDCNANPTAKANNAASSKSIFKEGVLESGGESQNSDTPISDDSVTLFFSRELAVKINPKRPDILASLIIYGLYLWQKAPVPAFGYTPIVNGHRGCYQSLSELQGCYSWVSEEAIRKAINRAEKALKGLLIVDRKNPNADRDKLHFWISPTLVKQYNFSAEKKKGLLALNAQDAVAYGVLEGILIGNLEYITDESRNSAPLVDEARFIYRELSPTKLTKPKPDNNGNVKSILPYSRKRVTEAIANLTGHGVFIEHPQKAGFYRLQERSDTVTKVAGDVTKVAGDVTKVARRVTKVARRSVVLDSNMLIDSDLQHISETSYTNTYTNACSNTDTKYLLPATAPLRSSVTGHASDIFPCAKMLMELVAEQLEVSRHKKRTSRPQIIFNGDEFCEVSSIECPISGLPMLANHTVDHELTYERIGIDLNTGKPYKRSAEIAYTIKDLKEAFQVRGIGYKAKDIEALRQVFLDNPLLHMEHFLELLDFLQPQNNGQYFTKIKEPKKGHDYFYFARRITTLGQMLRYLPHVVKEWYLIDSGADALWETNQERDEAGKPVFNYSEMEEPYFSLTFRGDTTTPLAHEYDSFNETGRPIYYAEVVGEPRIEYVEHECNPVLNVAA